MNISKKEIEERINSRKIFIESNLRFIKDYINSALESNNPKRIESCNIFKIAYEIEIKRKEIEILKNIL